MAGIRYRVALCAVSGLGDSMGFIVRLFFIAILTSVVLSAALGWFAIARAKSQLGKAFGRPPEKPMDRTNVIEGEYRVLEDDDKANRS